MSEMTMNDFVLVELDSCPPRKPWMDTIVLADGRIMVCREAREHGPDAVEIAIGGERMIVDLPPIPFSELMPKTPRIVDP